MLFFSFITVPLFQSKGSFDSSVEAKWSHIPEKTTQQLETQNFMNLVALKAHI